MQNYSRFRLWYLYSLIFKFFSQYSNQLHFKFVNLRITWIKTFRTWFRFSSRVGKHPAFDQLIWQSQRFLCRCLILSRIKMHLSLKNSFNDKDIRLWGHRSSCTRHSGIAFSLHFSPLLVPHSNILHLKKEAMKPSHSHKYYSDMARSAGNKKRLMYYFPFVLTIKIGEYVITPISTLPDVKRHYR